MDNASCNIIKHTTFGNGGITTKITTTTTTSPSVQPLNANGAYYESVNLLNQKQLNSNKNVNVSIDDEMIAVKNNSHSNSATSNFISKTLERRQVKNSEC